MTLKAVFLAAMLAIVATAQAMPASAVAEGALEHVTTQKTVAKGVQFSYTGGVEFSTGFGGINCAVHTTLTTKLADEFEVSKFDLTTATCEGSGFLAGCKVKEDKPTLPWTTGRYSTTELELFVFMDLGFEKCIIGSMKTEGTLVKGKPATGVNGGITALTLSGKGTVLIGEMEVEVSVSGALSMAEENSDTYRIEELP